MKYIGFLLLFLGCSLASFGQDVYSKYPCDSTKTFDILLTPARFVGTPLKEELKLNQLLASIEDRKGITGRFFVKFVINCDGSTKEFDHQFAGNTLNNDAVKQFMLKLAQGQNWQPAIHNEHRVPFRKMIFIEIKKGKVKKLSL